MYDKAIMNGKVWLGETYQVTNVYINDDRIARISKTIYPAKESMDVSGDLVFPGLIDPHVHFDLDLGHIRSKDNFIAGSRQAAYGGVSAFIDFLDPVDNPEDLEKAYHKRRAEVRSSYVDYFFHATIKNPKCDLEDFVKKMLDLDIHSLKLFTTYADSNRRTYDSAIIELLKLSEKYHFLLLAHIENDEMITLDSYYSYYDLLKSRPTISETSEAMKLAGFVKEYGGYLYMVHLSSGETIKRLVQAYPELINKRFFIESCPHYFSFSNEDVKGDDGYLYTLAPPLRTVSEQVLLQRHINDVQCIGTDHCAFNRKDKMDLPLIKMPLGIGGIEFSFDMMYQLFGERIIDKMSQNIAKLYGKLNMYGTIKEGNYANLFIYHLGDNSIDLLHGDTDYSVYHKKIRRGKIVHHLLRGHFILKDSLILNPFGKEL